jgi:hypothetical protein
MLRSLRFSVPLLILLVLPTTASATTSATQAVHVQKGDRALLTLSAKGRRSLAKHRVQFVARKPGTRSKSSYSLPAKSGRWNFSTARGTASFRGTLQLRSGRRSLNLGSVSFSRPAKGATVLTAILRGHRVRLLRLTGRVRVKHNGAFETVTGLSARMAQASVKVINRLWHRRAVNTGELLGSFVVTVSSASASNSPASGTTRASSGVGVTFANQFASALGGPSSILPISPASPGLPAPLGTTTIPGADGAQITFPVAGGSAAAGFDRGTLTGTVPLSGGLTLDDGAASVSLTSPQLTLGTGTEGSALSFSVNGGPEAKVFSLDTSQLQKSLTSNGSLDLKGLLATLSTEGAASLNSALGTNAFTTGEPVGGLTVILPAQ